MSLMSRAEHRGINHAEVVSCSAVRSCPGESVIDDSVHRRANLGLNVGENHSWRGWRLRPVFASRSRSAAALSLPNVLDGRLYTRGASPWPKWRAQMTQREDLPLFGHSDSYN